MGRTGDLIGYSIWLAGCLASLVYMIATRKSSSSSSLPPHGIRGGSGSGSRGRGKGKGRDHGGGQRQRSGGQGRGSASSQHPHTNDDDNDSAGVAAGAAGAAGAEGQSSATNGKRTLSSEHVELISNHSVCAASGSSILKDMGMIRKLYCTYMTVHSFGALLILARNLVDQDKSNFELASKVQFNMLMLVAATVYLNLGTRWVYPVQRDAKLAYSRTLVISFCVIFGGCGLLLASVNKDKMPTVVFALYTPCALWALYGLWVQWRANAPDTTFMLGFVGGCLGMADYLLLAVATLVDGIPEPGMLSRIFDTVWYLPLATPAVCKLDDLLSRRQGLLQNIRE